MGKLVKLLETLTSGKDISKQINESLLEKTLWCLDLPLIWILEAEAQQDLLCVLFYESINGIMDLKNHKNNTP